MQDLSLHLLDIVQNSVSSGASKIIINISLKNDDLIICIKDNGKGIKQDILKDIKNPFTTSRTTRKVGLGIPLFSAAAETTGGKLEVESQLGKGTVIKAFFKKDSIDRQPIGDIGDTIKSIIVTSPETQIQLGLYYNNESFEFNTEKIKETLGSVNITEYEVLEWIKSYINERVVKLFGGVLDEIHS